MSEPRLCFLGSSHAARHLRSAASDKGFPIVRADSADVVFVSEDTPTDESGRRDMRPIRALLDVAQRSGALVVLTSAVEPGFCRSLALDVWHQAEILRIKDARFRAKHPEMHIVGSERGDEALPEPYLKYLAAFGCPILRMTWEEAEFAKLAINVMLAAQVDATNRLAAAAEKVGAKWETVTRALVLDRRIGPHAYLTPGRWQASSHLLRDDLTLRGIEAR